jgi:hypothetical protein
MSFIIDIFENLLKYNDTNVFIILDINNNIWFKMKDILTGKEIYQEALHKENTESELRNKWVRLSSLKQFTKDSTIGDILDELEG